MAWTYLRTWPFLNALRRFTTDLKRFAATHGKPDLYHATVTWAYFALIRERMHGRETDEPWEAFAAANPDLLCWRDGALLHYYDTSVLSSEIARKSSFFPARAKAPPRESLELMSESKAVKRVQTGVQIEARLP